MDIGLRTKWELLLVPAVCYFESLRELERRSATGKIKRLREFVFRVPERLIPITTAKLESAARIWGQARNMGLPSADNASLAADVIICAQALSLGIHAADYVVVTTNVRHLVRFVPAKEWTDIPA